MSELIMDAVLAAIGGAGGGDLMSKTVTENKTYRASDDGHDGYSQVIVQVPLQTTVITSNGDHWFDPDNRSTTIGGWYYVRVNVPSSGDGYTFPSGTSLTDITEDPIFNDDPIGSSANNYTVEVYLSVWEWGTTNPRERVGRAFHGRSAEYTVVPYIDLKDQNGTSASGFPHAVQSGESTIYNSNGYAQISKWDVDANGLLTVYWTTLSGSQGSTVVTHQASYPPTTNFLVNFNSGIFSVDNKS